MYEIGNTCDSSGASSSSHPSPSKSDSLFAIRDTKRQNGAVKNGSESSGNKSNVYILRTCLFIVAYRKLPDTAACSIIAGGVSCRPCCISYRVRQHSCHRDAQPEPVNGMMARQSTKTGGAVATTTAVVVVAFAITLMLGHVDGGIYVLNPTSRPVLNSAVFQSNTFEEFEGCPGCLNSGGPESVKARGEANTNGGLLRDYGDGEWPLLAAFTNGEVCDNSNFFERNEIAVRHGICGDPKQFALDSTNAYSTSPSLWPVLETFQEGGVMDIKVVMTDHLWGHLEFFLCNSADLDGGTSSVPRQECFNKNPLSRAEGDSANSPIDPKYPGRYYVDPPCKGAEGSETLPEGAQNGYVVNMQYQLPRGLTCEHCVLQMVYYTGNVCKYVGYDEFEPESWPSQCAPSKSDWIDVDRWMCGLGGAYPEEFWSCSDIAITADAPDKPSSPKEAETPSPSPGISSAPSATPTVVAAPPTAPPVTTATAAPSMAVPAGTGSPTMTAYTLSPTSSPTSAAVAGTRSPTTTKLTGAPTSAPTSAEEDSAPSAMDDETWSFGDFGSAGDDGDDGSGSGSSDGSLCDDPAENYGQCAGFLYRGSQCCEDGFECVKQNMWYSQCVPLAGDSACGGENEQCGGPGWTGTTCCVAGATCVPSTSDSSSCQYV